MPRRFKSNKNDELESPSLLDTLSQYKDNALETLAGMVPSRNPNYNLEDLQKEVTDPEKIEQAMGIAMGAIGSAPKLGIAGAKVLKTEIPKRFSGFEDMLGKVAGGYRQRLAPETEGILAGTLKRNDPVIESLRKKSEMASQLDQGRFQQIINSLLRKPSR